MENLFHQKAEIKKKLKDWEEFYKNKILLENTLIEKEINSKKEEMMVTVEDKIAHFDKCHNEENVIFLNLFKHIKLRSNLLKKHQNIFNRK